MKPHLHWVLVMGAMSGMSSGSSPADDRGQQPPQSNYPAARRGDTVDDYHGTKVADPYRWLEELDSPETHAWIEAENALTERYLEKIPQRAELKQRLTALWDFEKYSEPYERGGRYFYRYNAGLQNQGVLFSTKSLDEKGGVLIDPNKLSEDGTVALSGISLTKDGKLMAYALAEAGSDWINWKVREVETGKDRDDLIKWSKFSGAEWTPDAAGFFYTRFPEPQPGADLKAANYFAKLYYHRLATPQSEDTLIWKDDEHKDWRAGASVTDDGEYIVFTISKGTDDKYRVLWRPLTKPNVEPIHLVGDFDYDYSFIDNVGRVLYFRTNDDAPRGRLIAIDLDSPDRAHWREVIPQVEETLDGVHRVGDKLFALYLKDARSQVKVFGLDGKFEKEVELPGLGTVTGFGGDRDSKQTFYSFTSFARPATIYRYDLASGKSSLWKAPRVDFDPEAYETSQVFYTSKDGTKIPMFVTKKKTVALGPDTPCYLYGYGGFNIPLTPSFSPVTLAWLERGGVYAVANLRGGGEYGEVWHQGGTKLKKQNVFDDFIAAAEWLIENKYTSTPRLAIEGRSNGGLLVGACLTQRPELFGAALPGVGVLDMLRFHKFTIGWAWIDDYGSSDDAAEFKALYAYSPLHNLKPGACYPPTLITTADHDDRVFPAHSFKFAAALQAAQSCENPVLIRIESRAGHGAGKPTSKIIDEAVDKLAFLVKTLKLEGTKP
jgi:prolyl oligopeptidase